MSFDLSRRDFFLTSAATLAATGATVASSAARAADVKSATEGHPFRYCLNTSTIRECQYQGKKVDVVAEVEIAAKAGYTGIEPWIRSLDTYTKSGGSLSDLRKRIADAGLTVESAIGFSAFFVIEALSVIVVLRLTDAGWMLVGVHTHGNGPVPRAVVETVKEKLCALGILCILPSKPKGPAASAISGFRRDIDWEFEFEGMGAWD